MEDTSLKPALHQEGTAYLWPASNAKGLFKVLVLADLKDMVMHLVRPVDVVNFVLATGIMFSADDMATYTNWFKSIIPDRRWLLAKMREGYDFTVMGHNLVTFADSTTMQPRWQPQSALSDEDPLQSMSVTLILTVTRHNAFVPCDDKFLPTSLFQDATECASSAVCITGSSTDHTYRTLLISRTVVAQQVNAYITLLCPIIEQPTSESLQLAHFPYSLAFPSPKCSTADRRLNYMTMRQGKCKIGTCHKQDSNDETLVRGQLTLKVVIASRSVDNAGAIFLIPLPCRTTHQTNCPTERDIQEEHTGEHDGFGMDGMSA